MNLITSLVTDLISVVKAHPAFFVTVATIVVNDLINGLKAYPKLETPLRIASDLLSIHQSANSPGTFKMIGKRSTKPNGIAQPEVKGGAAAVLLPFLFGISIACSSCATPGAQAFKTCELGQLPTTVQSSIACGVSIATGVQPGGDVQDALQNCVKDFAPGQGSCIMQAIMSWLKGLAPQHGQPAPNLMVAISRIQIYLSAHPAGICAPPAQCKAYEGGCPSIEGGNGGALSGTMELNAFHYESGGEVIVLGPSDCSMPGQCGNNAVVNADCNNGKCGVP